MTNEQLGFSNAPDTKIVKLAGVRSKIVKITRAEIVYTSYSLKQGTWGIYV
jgi:hypothetical protein